VTDWKDRLRPAIFRGVPFGVETYSHTGGRRVGVHEYPLRDTPFVEEMGRVARTYSIEAFLVGDDFAERRDRLVERLEGASAGFPRKPGGTLIHPTLGQVEVLCTRFEVQESTREGRMARIAIEFVEAGREIQPFGAVDPVGSADQAAAASGAAAGAGYEGAVQTTGVVQEAFNAIEEVLRTADDRLRRLDVFSGNARDVLALQDSLTVLITTASELVTAPADLLGTATDALDAVLGAASSASGALEAYRVLFDLEGIDAPGDGPQAVAIRANGTAAANLFRALALGGAVRAAARVAWPTLEDALATREELEALLDELASGTDDDLNRELAALREALVNAVPPADQTLPEIVTFTPPQSMPALVIAHRLYQDPSRDQEIVDRNHVPNPLRVTGGAPLSVLSR